MKMHPSLVERLIYWVNNFGGHQYEAKLKELFSGLKVSPYVRKDSLSNPVVLVESERYIKERINIGQTFEDVIPMTLHQSVVDHLIWLFESLSGHKDEEKLRAKFSALDFTPYQRKVSGEQLVVLTKDYMDALRK